MRKAKVFCNVSSTAERGHWRSGRFWCYGGTDVDVRDVTDAMRADPRLRIVEVTEVDADDA